MKYEDVEKPYGTVYADVALTIKNPLSVGLKVKRVNSDYTFEGTIVSVFQKVSRHVRYVVEDDRGVLFIMSAKNLQPLEWQ